MKFKSIYSPNFDKKDRSKKTIKFIIIHYTGMQSERESLKRLSNTKFKVSCHYLVNRKGKIYSMVKDENEAWHAGKSKWKKSKNLNRNSIGIELVNKGHSFGYQKFTKVQINKLISLCKYLKKKYKIKNNLILGHSDIAPLRKIDPGEKFPWKYLSLKGIGNYPKNLKILNRFKRLNNDKFFFKNLQKIGYRYLTKKNYTKIIKNFQRRYRQNRVNGIIDLETFEISRFLSKK